MKCIQRCEVTYTTLLNKALNGQVKLNRIVREHEGLTEEEIQNAIKVVAEATKQIKEARKADEGGFEKAEENGDKKKTGARGGPVENKIQNWPGSRGRTPSRARKKPYQERSPSLRRILLWKGLERQIRMNRGSHP